MDQQYCNCDTFKITGGLFASLKKNVCVENDSTGQTTTSGKDLRPVKSHRRHLNISHWSGLMKLTIAINMQITTFSVSGYFLACNNPIFKRSKIKLG